MEWRRPFGIEKELRRFELRRTFVRLPSQWIPLEWCETYKKECLEEKEKRTSNNTNTKTSTKSKSKSKSKSTNTKTST